MPTFDVIVTTFNRLDYTRRTIGSLIKSGAHEKCQRFIIIDNHSTDEGMESFLNDMSHYQKVFVVRRPSNDGWATAVNDALSLSRAEYVFLSNNDVEYEDNFLDRMFESFSLYPNIGILAVWRHIGHGLTPNGINDANFRDMDNVPAVGWLMPKKAIEVVGMLSQNGPCLTKGGNGEDTAYVGRMKTAGFLVGAYGRDLGNHFDGY